MPPLQGAPSLTVLVVHLPEAQEVAEQAPEVLHTVQAPPPVPQVDREVPVWQVVPVQQPVQVVVLQVPPQPSLAPTHLFLQSGAHSHRPRLHTWPPVQVPQVPPQPSGPHCLPPQEGVQAVQVLLTQVPLLVVQSTQDTPLEPHSVSLVPPTQPLLEQQPAQVLALQPQMASGQMPVSGRRSNAWSAGGGRSTFGGWSTTGTVSVGALSLPGPGTQPWAQARLKLAANINSLGTVMDISNSQHSVRGALSGDQ